MDSRLDFQNILNNQLITSLRTGNPVIDALITSFIFCVFGWVWHNIEKIKKYLGYAISTKYNYLSSWGMLSTEKEFIVTATSPDQKMFRALEAYMGSLTTKEGKYYLNPDNNNLSSGVDPNSKTPYKYKTTLVPFVYGQEIATVETVYKGCIIRMVLKSAPMGSLCVHLYNSNSDKISEFCSELAEAWIRNKTASCWVYSLSEDGLCFIRGNRIKQERTIKSLYLSESWKNSIMNQITQFRDRNWYDKRNIPYHLGMMLYGTPGCGKTSLAFAMACETGRNMYAFSLYDIENDAHLKKLWASIPDDSVILMEDIDCMGSAFKNRDLQGPIADPARSSTTNQVQIEQDGSRKCKTPISMSVLLNLLDGAQSKDGQLVIMTTNKIDTIDPAVLRPGRCDITVELTKCTKEQLEQIYRRFFPEEFKPLLADFSTGTFYPKFYTLPDNPLDKDFSWFEDSVLSPAEVLSFFRMAQTSNQVKPLIIKALEIRKANPEAMLNTL